MIQLYLRIGKHLTIRIVLLLGRYLVHLGKHFMKGHFQVYGGHLKAVAAAGVGRGRQRAVEGEMSAGHGKATFKDHGILERYRFAADILRLDPLVMDKQKRLARRSHSA